MDISVVVPLYNEEETLPLLVEKVTAVMRASGKAWELVAVDDGSRDGTAQVLARLAAETPELQPVYFRRNYGQTAAMQAGFDHAEGEIVVTMDGDLQNDPADIPRLIAHLEATGTDIVSGWRKNRQDHALKRNLPSRIANSLIAKTTGVHLHDYGCSLKAYRKDVLEDLRIYGELHRFIPAIAAQYGAKVTELEVSHKARQFGESKYGIDRTIRVALDIIQVFFFQKFLHRPMHFFGYAGLVLMVPGGLMMTYLFLIKLFGADIGGRPMLLTAMMLILLGVQLLGMGLLAELLVRIYHEPLGRKQYVLRSKPPAKKARKTA